MRCWSCGQRFEANIVLRDALLRGRSPQAGGPYRLYHCPRCHKASRVESTPGGNLFASPQKDVALADYLFGWIPGLSPVDFLKILDWHQRHEEERRAFFEREGDRRYSRPSFKRWIRRLWGGRPRPAPQPSRRARQRPSTTGSGGSPGRREPEPVPHPYRILGVPPGAGEDEIRTAFRELVRKWHPDKRRSEPGHDLDEARRRLQELLEAYEQLRNDSRSRD